MRSATRPIRSWPLVLYFGVAHKTSWIAGEDIFDRPLNFGRPNDPFYRIRLTPDGAVLVGDGQSAPSDALASDAAANVASRRTLGTGALQAAPGNATIPRLLKQAGNYHRPAITTTLNAQLDVAEFRLWPVELPDGIIRRVCFNVFTAGDAASRVRPLIYLPDAADYGPGTLLVDGGLVDTSTVAILVPSVPNTAFAGGIVWVGIHQEAGVSASVTIATTYPSPMVVTSSNIVSTVGRFCVRSTTFPTGAPPSPFPAGYSAGIQAPPVVGIECY